MITNSHGVQKPLKTGRNPKSLMSRKGIYIMMNWNKQRLALIAIAAIGMLCTFLPWMSLPLAGSINGTKGDGWFTFLFFGVSLSLAFLGEKTEAFGGVKFYIASLFSLLAGGLGLYKIIDFNSKMSAISENPFAQAISATVSIDFGLYLLALAGFAFPILGFILGRNNTNLDSQ